MNYWKNLLGAILKRNNLIISLLFVFLCSFSTVYADRHERRKAVVVIVNFTNIDEFADMPNLNRLMQNGAVGLMNTRGASKTDNARAYASLGWGSRADVQAAHSLVEKRQDSLYLKYIDEIKNSNIDNPYNVKVGLLGDFFHERGLKTSFIGSQGNQEQQLLLGALIAADSKGVIDSGTVEREILTYDSGINDERTDYESLLNVFEQEFKKSDLVVLDTGETSRYEYYKGAGQIPRMGKEDILQDIDKFIGELSNVIDSKNTLLMVLSPHYGAEDGKYGRKLCPVIFYGQDIKPGLLFSDTTRREGIIANIDIAPTIIQFFEGVPKDITGQAVKIKETAGFLEKVSELSRLTAFNSLNRSVVLKAYVAFQIVLLIIILVFILISAPRMMLKKDTSIQEKQEKVGSRYFPKMNKTLRILVLFILICPVVLFVMPLLNMSNLFIYSILLVSISCISAVLIYRMIPNQETSVIVVSLLTVSCILIDLLFNGPLNKTSLLGYDAVIGARYYGLGNEYMGVLIASSLMGIVPLAQKNKLPKWTAVLLLIMILPIIGLTVFGANVGGTIAATMGFGFASLRLFNRRITTAKIMVLFSAVLIVVGLFAVYDIFFAAHKSHLARALFDFNDRGIDVIFDIIRRKLEMNLKLLRWTIWSKVLIVSVAVVGILFLRPRGMLHMLLNKYKSFSTAWYSILVASIVGMIVNDSGVVVAATSNIFLAFSLLYFLLGEEENGIHRIRKNRS